LEQQFPLVHLRCEKTVIHGYSLLYRWPGIPSCPGQKPILITAHMDVVPVEPGTESAWQQPPFSGNLANGAVWGRGALDTKVHLIAAMQAMEQLIGEGFTPARDIYLGFGHDEEITGEEGARHIADYLAKSGITFDFVLDEGGCVVQNVLEGVSQPIAMVGVGEKGFANIRLSVRLDGGHSSMPAPHTSLGVLAKALCLIEAHPFKPRLIPSTQAFLLKLAPYMHGAQRVILANLWLFRPLFVRVFSKTNTGSALLRTTVAVTMAQGSPAPNVVPQHSTACINCRILPGENDQTMMEHFRKLLRKLPVKVEAITLDEPSALSSSDSESFRFVESLIHACCGDTLVVPYLVMASTDARKYEAVSEHIYRFTPYVIDQQDLGRIHGTDETISIVNVNRCIDFFTALMKNA
ncbi:MAG TPA: M20/M25/M40 family metallo-hydrolase, partial [Candidatus Limiplasma sp.]|nr:M20/M25/M40 family metallo-hydrolase [Candidatus Limiplasma sp.]